MTPQQASRPEHRDLEGLTEFITQYFGAVATTQQIAIAEAAWYQCMSRRAPAPTSEPGARDAEMLIAQRDQARAQYDRCFQIMMSVFNLIGPAQDFKAPDGTARRFMDPNAAETLHYLSAAIKAIPEKLSAITAPASAAVPAPTIDTPRFRELLEEYDDAVGQIQIGHALNALIAHINESRIVTVPAPAPLAPMQKLDYTNYSAPVTMSNSADPSPLVAQASPELPEPFGWAIRGTILRERFQLYLASDEADRNYHDHAKNYRYQGEAVHEIKPLYEHPAPEASPLVEDAQRIVAGKVEAEWPKMNPACRCQSCNPQMVGQMMFLCPTCGNKRCPHANDHRNDCTNSNEPGQKGSAYELQDRATTGNATADDGKDM